MTSHSAKERRGLAQEISPAATVITLFGIVLLAAFIWLIVHNPFRGVPPPPNGKPAAGGPPIPPPPGPDIIRHGPIGP